MYHYAFMLLTKIIHAVKFYQKMPSTVGSIPLLWQSPKDLLHPSFCCSSIVLHFPFFRVFPSSISLTSKAYMLERERGSCLNWYHKAQVLIGSFCTMQQPQHCPTWYFSHLLICESGNREAKGSRSTRTVLWVAIIVFLCWVFALMIERQ